MADPITLRQLRYFCVLAEELNFRRAAERLFISQPPLSRQIRQLEDALGAPLLIRHMPGSTQPVILTEAGQRFLPQVQQLLEQMDLLLQRFSEDNDLSVEGGRVASDGQFLTAALTSHEHIHTHDNGVLGLAGTPRSRRTSALSGTAGLAAQMAGNTGQNHSRVRSTGSLAGNGQAASARHGNGAGAASDTGNGGSPSGALTGRVPKNGNGRGNGAGTGNGVGTSNGFGHAAGNGFSHENGAGNGHLHSNGAEAGNGFVHGNGASAGNGFANAHGAEAAHGFGNGHGSPNGHDIGAGHGASPDHGATPDNGASPGHGGVAGNGANPGHGADNGFANGHGAGAGNGFAHTHGAGSVNGFTHANGASASNGFGNGHDAGSAGNGLTHGNGTQARHGFTNGNGAGTTNGFAHVKGAMLWTGNAGPGANGQTGQAAPRAPVRPLILRVGITPVIDITQFAWLKEAMQEEMSHVHIDAQLTNSAQLIRNLMRGRLDAAIIGMPAWTDGLQITPLHREAMMVCLSSSHPLARKRRLSLAHISEERLFWFLRRQNPVWYDHAQRVFMRHHFSPPRQSEPADHHVLLGLVAAGHGIALVPMSLCSTRRPGLAFRPLAEGDELAIGVALARREQGYSRPVLHAINVLKALLVAQEKK